MTHARHGRAPVAPTPGGSAVDNVKRNDSGLIGCNLGRRSARKIRSRWIEFGHSGSALTRCNGRPCGFLERHVPGPRRAPSRPTTPDGSRPSHAPRSRQPSAHHVGLSNEPMPRCYPRVAKTVAWCSDGAGRWGRVAGPTAADAPRNDTACPAQMSPSAARRDSLGLGLGDDVSCSLIAHRPAATSRS